MKLKRSLIALAISLGAGGTVGFAHASAPTPAITLDYFTETPTTLQAQWSVTGGVGSFSAGWLGAYWDVLDVTGYLGGTGSITFGPVVVPVTVNQFNVEAQHGMAPHVGEAALGPIYSTSALNQTLVQIANSGTTSFVSAMDDHNGGAWVLNADWTTPHWDHYKFTATSNTDGTATLLLQAVHPVPEPGSYAMMLAGLGLVGLIVRRRRQG